KRDPDRSRRARSFVERSRRGRMMMRALLALGLLSALMGCAVGHDYSRPDLGIEEALWDGRTATSTTIRVTNADPCKRWWTIFHDEELERVVGQAMSGNPDLLAAIARVRAARQVTRQAFAPLLPTVDAEADYAYQKQ